MTVWHPDRQVSLGASHEPEPSTRTPEIDKRLQTVESVMWCARTRSPIGYRSDIQYLSVAFHIHEAVAGNVEEDNSLLSGPPAGLSFVDRSGNRVSRLGSG